MVSGDGLAEPALPGPEAAIDDLIARFDAGVVRRAKDLIEPPGQRLGAMLDFLDDGDESD